MTDPKLVIPSIFVVVWSMIEQSARPFDPNMDLMIGEASAVVEGRLRYTPCLMGTSLEDLVGKDAMSARSRVLSEPIPGTVVLGIKPLGYLEIQHAMDYAAVFSVRVGEAMHVHRGRPEPLYAVQLYTRGTMVRRLNQASSGTRTLPESLADAAFMRWFNQSHDEYDLLLQ